MDIIVLSVGVIALGWAIMCVRERRLLWIFLMDSQWRRSPPGGFLYELGFRGVALSALLMIVDRFNQLGERWFPKYNHWLPAILMTVLALILLGSINDFLLFEMDEEIKQKQEEERKKRNKDPQSGD